MNPFSIRRYPGCRDTSVYMTCPRQVVSDSLHTNKRDYSKINAISRTRQIVGIVDDIHICVYIYIYMIYITFCHRTAQPIWWTLQTTARQTQSGSGSSNCHERKFFFIFFLFPIYLYRVKTFSHWLFSHVALCTHITSTHIKYTKCIKSILEVKVQRWGT